VEDLEEKRGKVEKGGVEEKEWPRREGRNPRNVFGPEAPVTTAGRAATAYPSSSVAQRR